MLGLYNGLIEWTNFLNQTEFQIDKNFWIIYVLPKKWFIQVHLSLSVYNIMYKNCRKSDKSLRSYSLFNFQKMHRL